MTRVAKGTGRQQLHGDLCGRAGGRRGQAGGLDLHGVRDERIAQDSARLADPGPLARVGRRDVQGDAADRFARPAPGHGGAKETHSNYLEVVEIGGHRLETELRCDFKSAPKWAATSYDLDRSIGDMLQVDRGYLMVADVGGRRHVKALKVVGFTNTLLNTVATDVCPEWSTWVQRATAVTAVQAAGGINPTPGSIGDADPTVSWSTEGAAAFTGGVAEQLSRP